MSEQLLIDLKATRSLINISDKWAQFDKRGRHIIERKHPTYCLANAIISACQENIIRQKEVVIALGFS